MSIALRLVAAALLSLIPSLLHAQHDYDVWYFGYRLGIDFRQNPPALLQGAPINTAEGSANICDRHTGEPLFSCDGTNVFNRDGLMMPNGTGLLGGMGTSTQAALIVPNVCDSNRYYIFTADQEGYAHAENSGIHYSIVDMEMDFGNGDVVEKNVPVLPKASEHLVAVMHANGHDYWVLTHGLGGESFYAFLVNADGVSMTPVVSAVGSSHGDPVATGEWTLGYLKGSPDGRRLALAANHIGLLEAYDFDPATGVVSSPVRLLGDSIPIPGNSSFVYSCTFSPDGSKLYAAIGYGLTQWSVDLASAAAIQASSTVVNDTALRYPNMGLRGMQIGPDGQIYVGAGEFYMGVVTSPNATGRACAYIDTAYRFSTRGLRSGLPNNIDSRSFFKRPQPMPRIEKIDVRQEDPCSGATLSAPEGYLEYRWSTGERTRSIEVVSSRGYEVTVTDSNGCRSSAAVDVEIHAPFVRTSPDRHAALCEGDSIVLSTETSEPYRALFWSTGDSSRSITVWDSGRYTVELVDEYGCRAYDTVDVTIVQGRVVRLSLSSAFGVTPGDSVALSLRLEDAFPNVPTVGIVLVVTYDTNVVRPAWPIDPSIADRMKRGTLLDGWEVKGERLGADRLRLELIPSGGAGSIQGIGEILRLLFATHVSMTDGSAITMESKVSVEADILISNCISTETSSGTVSMTLCGISYRLIELINLPLVVRPNAPNPFMIATEFSFELGYEANARLSIFDAGGRNVAVLLDETLPAGEHVVTWEPHEMPAGWYTYHLEAAGETRTGRMLLVK